MTEEEKKAWRGVTDEAAKDVVDTVREAAALTLLRGAIRQLASMHGQRPEARAGVIYMALMAATDAGYRCGIRVQYKWNLMEGCFAVIHTPAGMLTFELLENWDSVDRSDIDETPVRISAFLGDDGVGHDGKTQEGANEARH